MTKITPTLLLLLSALSHFNSQKIFIASLFKIQNFINIVLLFFTSQQSSDMYFKLLTFHMWYVNICINLCIQTSADCPQRRILHTKFNLWRISRKLNFSLKLINYKSRHFRLAVTHFSVHLFLSKVSSYSNNLIISFIFLFFAKNVTPPPTTIPVTTFMYCLRNVSLCLI